MNVAFIYSLDDVQSSSAPLRTLEQIQFGISYISSFLKEKGHNTRLIVLSRVFGAKYKSVIDKTVKEFSPGIFCFTAVSSQYAFIATVAQYVKKSYPDSYLLAGGCHVSLNPKHVLSTDFDALCIGEGEMPALELIEQLEKNISPAKIPNLWIKRDNAIEKNAARPFMQDLDNLPFPDRQMWRNWIKEQPGSRVSILLGRGCPFECTYCCNSALKKITDGSYVRLRSPGNILAEIKNIIDTYPRKKDIYFEVESFGINIPWAIGLCDELENLNKKLDTLLSFGVNLRIVQGADYRELFAALRKANFRFINIGLESGSEKLRRQILGRNYSNEDIISAVRLARKNGLKVNLFNMIGIYGETQSDFKETVRLNRICAPDNHMTGIFFPYPGTKLYSLCEEKGLLKNELNPQMERRKAVLELPGFSKKQIQNSYYWFDYYIYKGHRPLVEILAKVIALKFQANLHLNLFFRNFVRMPIINKIKYDFANR